MENFNLATANQLSVSEAKAYITKYFYPLTDGQHVLLKYIDSKPEFDILDDTIVRKVYFNRLPKVIQQFYFTEYDQIRTLTCELNKPFVYDSFINTCPTFMHSVKPYSEYSNDIKHKVSVMLNYVKEIWASNNEASFQFIVKWLANMARGGKNQSVLYLRSEEGIGKSTFTDFLRKHVIGNRLCVQTGSQPLISNFNKILFCKLLVIFEELENFSTSQWQGVSTRLKRNTTSDTCTYEEKNEKLFVAKNISNYIINSNVDAIKDDNGRRYFILDLNNSRKGDIEFFDNIYKNCINDEVGEAFFSFLHTIDLSGYHDQDFPATNAKQDSIVKRLDSVIRFLKENYILRNKDFDTNLKDVYAEYVVFCDADGSKACCKIEFNKRLESVNIKSYKCGNIHNKFKIKKEMMIEIATKNKWMHSTDSFESEEPPEVSNLDIPDPKDAQILEMRAEIERLKAELQKHVYEEPEIVPEVLAQQIEMAQQQKQAIKKAMEKADSEVKKKRGRKPKEPSPVKVKSPLDADIDELENLCG